MSAEIHEQCRSHCCLWMHASIEAQRLSTCPLISEWRGVEEYRSYVLWYGYGVINNSVLVIQDYPDLTLWLVAYLSYLIKWQYKMIQWLWLNINIGDMNIMPECEQQFLYRPLIVPKIVTTYHYNQEYQTMDTNHDYVNEINLQTDPIPAENVIKINGNRSKLDSSDSLEDENCKCSICSKRTNEIPRCTCNSSNIKRSPSPFRRSPSPFRRSPSPMAAYGYEIYQKSLLEVPFIPEYGDASSDDLSSEWDSDVPDLPPRPVHPKVCYIK